MANPRKFADKLEIIRRKEEEANAAYVQIMRECAELSDARKGSPVHAPNMHIPSHHNQQAWGRSPNEYMKCGIRQMWKGGSLPNVHSSPNNNSVNNVNVNPQQNSYGLNDGFQHQQQTYGGGGVVSIRHGRSMDPPSGSGPIFPSRNKYPHRYIVTQPYKNNLLQQPSLMEEQNESPGWRRAASDSAIQQTLGEPPKPNVNGSGSNLQHNSAARLIQSPNQQTSHTDLHNLARSPPVSIRYPDTNRNNMKMTADTSSLPDLSNLSIPSPIQNPIDIEQEGKANSKPRDPQNHFQAPYTIPRRVKQIYTRQGSASDIIETIQREPKPGLNLFPEVNSCSSNATVSNAAMTHSVSAPLSPVTPPPFFWNSTPISPLATTDILPQHSSAAATDLQQQLFQIHNDGVRDNGTSNPPPYNFPPPEEDSYNNFCSNNYLNNKQNLYRMNSGPANLSSSSKSICDHQLESALMRVKAEQGLDPALLRVKPPHHQEHELSPADLNSVRVALHPLDFDDVQMLADNVQLVDQSAEEQFRLERASFP